MNSELHGYDPDHKWTPVVIDTWAHVFITQGPEHYMTHKGYHYTLGHYFADVDTSGYARIRFVTSATKYFHAYFFIVCSTGATLCVYEATSFTHNASNVITAYNRHRPLAATQVGETQAACHTPSGSGAGTAIGPVFPVGTGGNKVTASPGQGRDQSEYVLKLDTAYLIEAQSLADNNAITIGVDYYWRT